jgi:hypothetical protein
MNDYSAEAAGWVRNGTRVHATWATGTGTQAEGIVIGYAANPSVIVKTDAGDVVHVITGGTIITPIETPPPTERVMRLAEIVREHGHHGMTQTEGINIALGLLGAGYSWADAGEVR